MLKILKTNMLKIKIENKVPSVFVSKFQEKYSHSFTIEIINGVKILKKPE